MICLGWVRKKKVGNKEVINKHCGSPLNKRVWAKRSFGRLTSVSVFGSLVSSCRIQQDSLPTGADSRGLSAHIPAAIISVLQSEPIKSLKLLTPLLNSDFFISISLVAAGKGCLHRVLNNERYFCKRVTVTLHMYYNARPNQHLQKRYKPFPALISRR